MADTKTTPARALAAAAEAAARRAAALLDAGLPETQELAVRMLEAATRALAQAGPLPIEPAPRSGPVRLPLVPPARSAKARGRVVDLKEPSVVTARLLDTLVAAGLVPPKLVAELGKKLRIKTPLTHGAGGGFGFQGAALGGLGGTFGGVGSGSSGGGVPGQDGDGGTPVGEGTGNGTGIEGTGDTGTGTDGTGGTGTGTDGTGGTGTGTGSQGTEASGPGTDGGAANDPNDPGRYVAAIAITADGEIELIAGEEVVVGEAIEATGATVGGAILGLFTLVLAVVTVPSDEAVPELPKPTAEECKEIKEGCIADCLDQMEREDLGGMFFHKCKRFCMETKGCFNG